MRLWLKITSQEKLRQLPIKLSELFFRNPFVLFDKRKNLFGTQRNGCEESVTPSIIHLHTWKQPVRETSASSLYEPVLPPPLCQRIIDTKWHTSLHISTNSPWLLQLSQMAVRAKICTVFRKWGILQPRSISQYHEPVRPIRNLSTICYRITLSIRNTILVS